MTSVKAYYDGQKYITEENINIQKNQKVIITILEEFVTAKSKKTLSEIKNYMNSNSKSVPEGISTKDYIRQLRADI
ncbi:hypothetical protein [Treponema pectinovorum]|uniref:hypothetical protein n=1 Tax=Treponema pectinovorum TaxID=164 RepID=UPI0011F40613|nr:hypothetical protein [Treponema pectinovorum]